MAVPLTLSYCLYQHAFAGVEKEQLEHLPLQTTEVYALETASLMPSDKNLNSLVGILLK